MGASTLPQSRVNSPDKIKQNERGGSETQRAVTAVVRDALIEIGCH
jgi:hypothetical protein